MGASLIAIAGARGFVGGAIAKAAGRAGYGVLALPSIRVPPTDPADCESSIARWLRDNRALTDVVIASLSNTGILINATGVAAPASSDIKDLVAANSCLPVILGCLSKQAGVKRLIHLSSAAVQGWEEELDETTRYVPRTPYGNSKALGEALLLEGRQMLPEELVIYRPTSVQGRGRRMTQQLVRLAHSRFAVLCNDGDTPVPVALIENVAAAAVYLAAVSNPPSVATHPSENVTARSLMSAFGDRASVISIPRTLAGAAIAVLGFAGKRQVSAAVLATRLSQLWRGQRQIAVTLTDCGYVPPSGLDGYRELGRLVAQDLGLGPIRPTALRHNSSA